jgi:hypothetical protein
VVKALLLLASCVVSYLCFVVELGELQAMQMEVATQQLFLLKNRIKRRPDNRGDSWIPTPESGYQSPAVLSVVGVGAAIHTESKADANDYELKERDYYIDLFKKHFNIEYNTSQGYFVVNNREEFKIMLTAFGSTDVVHSNSGRNKEVKNDYMTLKLCDCQIDKFLVEIAKQGGKAKRDLWQQTTP